MEFEVIFREDMEFVIGNYIDRFLHPWDHAANYIPIRMAKKHELFGIIDFLAFTAFFHDRREIIFPNKVDFLF